MAQREITPSYDTFRKGREVFKFRCCFRYTYKNHPRSFGNNDLSFKFFSPCPSSRKLYQLKTQLSVRCQNKNSAFTDITVF